MSTTHRKAKIKASSLATFKEYGTQPSRGRLQPATCLMGGDDDTIFIDNFISSTAITRYKKLSTLIYGDVCHHDYAGNDYIILMIVFCFVSFRVVLFCFVSCYFVLFCFVSFWFLFCFV